jgi:peptidoglycan/LPS O-acetylase OafA/YrhL
MVETPASSSGSRLGVLDGLRGIAILVVLWYHTWEWNWLNTEFTAFGRHVNLQFIPETGFTGVDLFFFISGFVLFYPYGRTLFEGRPLQAIGHFAYRRFIKIVPSYYLQIVILTPWILAAFAGSMLFWQYLTHLTFTFNWFRDTAGSINGVWWTLALEVQFYVVFPLFCWCMRRWPLATYIGMLVIANAYRLATRHCCVGDWVVQSQMLAFLDLFGSGMFAAWLFTFLHNRVKQVSGWQPLFTALALGGFAAYAMLLYSLYKVRVIPDWQYVWSDSYLTLLGVTFVVLTVASCLASAWWRALLGNRVLVFFSIISYNLYLWHQLIGTFLAKHSFPLARTAAFATDRLWQWSFTLLSVAVSIAVASIITYGFERPLLRRGFHAFSDLFTRRTSRAAAPTARTAPE